MSAGRSALQGSPVLVVLRAGLVAAAPPFHPLRSLPSACLPTTCLPRAFPAPQLDQDFGLAYSGGAREGRGLTCCSQPTCLLKAGRLWRPWPRHRIAPPSPHCPPGLVLL